MEVSKLGEMSSGNFPSDTTRSKMDKANLSQFSYGNETIERNKQRRKRTKPNQNPQRTK